MVNQNITTINEKKLILTDQINAKLIDNSLIDIDNSNLKSNKLITTIEETHIEDEIKQTDSNSKLKFSL